MELLTRNDWRVARIVAVFVCGGALSACSGGGSTQSSEESADQVSSQQQLALVDNFLFSAPVPVKKTGVSVGKIGGGVAGQQQSIVPEPQVDSEDEDVAQSYPLRLSWQTSVTNEEEGCAANILSYRFNLGLSPSAYTESDLIPTGEISCSAVSNTACGEIRQCSVTLQVSRPAAWYIALQAVDQYGQSSDYSNEVVATVY